MISTLFTISGSILTLAGGVYLFQKWREHRAVKRRIDKIEG